MGLAQEPDHLQMRWHLVPPKKVSQSIWVGGGRGVEY